MFFVFGWVARGVICQNVQSTPLKYLICKFRSSNIVPVGVNRVGSVLIMNFISFSVSFIAIFIADSTAYSELILLSFPFYS